jgi:predicted secreted acid phosphatase
MRLYTYLNERKSEYGKGITFVDIDETVFSTFAKIHVIDKETGEVIRKLDNQEFNFYQLKDNEEFDFKEFEDAKLFRQTSKPIIPTIERLKRMISMLKKNKRGSKIIFLTARSDFDNKQEFLQTFREHGIDVDFRPTVYIERVGNLKSGTIPERKERVILSYLKREQFRRVRMIDDHDKNVKQFLNMTNKISNDIIEDVRQEYNIPENEPVMEFFGLLIDPKSGKLTLVDKKEVY